MRTVRIVQEVVAEATGKRRHRSKQERREVVEETLQPGASVAVIARRHGVNANQVFHWRKLYREGRLDAAPNAAPLLPVRIAEVVSTDHPPTRLHAGVILVELGRARIRIEGSVDSENLRVILERAGR